MIVKVGRSMLVDTEEFETGDDIAINRINDLAIACVVVDVTDKIATVISLNTVFNMALNYNKCASWLESDLRKYLNSDFYNSCDPWVRDKLIKDSNGDYFSIPSEKEIFGRNKYGEYEGNEVVQWSIMKDRKYRIALTECGTNMYFLRTKPNDSLIAFCGCSEDGDPILIDAHRSRGVRPCFRMPASL